MFLTFVFYTEPLSHTENGISNESSTKDPSPSTLHTSSDYRATKKERPFYPGQTHTPPPLRRVSSNPTELGPVCVHRRVEGRVKHIDSEYISFTNPQLVLQLVAEISQLGTSNKSVIQLSCNIHWTAVLCQSLLLFDHIALSTSRVDATLCKFTWLIPSFCSKLCSS